MTDLIARLEELEKAATPGPWTETGDPHLCCDCPGSLDTGANVAIVLELRNNFPAILHALKVQQAAEAWALARQNVGYRCKAHGCSPFTARDKACSASGDAHENWHTSGIPQ